MTPRREAIDFNLKQHKEASSAIYVSQKLIEAGFEAFLAGGAVRDLIIGRSPKDFDIATNAKPEEVLKLFKNTRKVGIAFGVVLVADVKPTIEVATFRTDVSYSDGRHPDKVVFSTASEDAQRRDFTSNGLFYDLNKNEIVDYVGGIDDIKQNILRAIGHAPDRFEEDYLRMLRAIRFAITLNFQIETCTWKALMEHAHKIEGIAKDRVHEELRKTFIHGRSDSALKLLSDSKLLKHSLLDHSQDWKLTLNAADQGGHLAVILALCYHHIEDKEKLEHYLNQLRCSNPEKKVTHALIRSNKDFHTYPQLEEAQQKRCLRQFDKEELKFFIEHFPHYKDNEENIFKDLEKWTSEDYYPSLMLKGKDLIAAGFEKGPIMGEVLYDLETKLLNRDLTSSENVRDWLEQQVKTNS